MACPACGGSDRVAIALGYWRCNSPVGRTTIIGVPINPAAPNSVLRPHQQIHYGPCGFEYQEATSAMPEVPACKCGMFSVGSCTRCKKYVCGTHGRLVSGMFLCKEHAEAEEQQVRARQDQEAAARAAAARASSVVKLGQGEIPQKIARLKKLLLESDKAPWEERRTPKGYRTNHANPFRAFFGRSTVTVYAPLEPAIPIGVLSWDFPNSGDTVFDTVTGEVRSGLTAAGIVVKMNYGYPGEESTSNGGALSSGQQELIAERLEQAARKLGLRV